MKISLDSRKGGKRPGVCYLVLDNSKGVHVFQTTVMRRGDHGARDGEWIWITEQMDGPISTRYPASLLPLMVDVSQGRDMAAASGIMLLRS